MRNNAFFLGKGGVGKTTVSAAFSLELAKRGRRVLAVSLDPAHNLGDALGLELSDRPKAAAERLSAMEVDLGAWVERYLEESRLELKATYAYNSSFNLDSFFDIMRYSPGTEEYAVLWAIEHVHCELSADFDVVVYDTPPTALSLRFLALPTISGLWVRELTKLRERILEKRQVVTRLNPESPTASSCVDKDDDRVYGKLAGISRRLGVLHRLFAEESFLSVILNPDVLSVSEALRIKDELDRIGIGLHAACLNKRGVSTAAWNLDERLRKLPLFELDYKGEGIRTLADLARVDVAALAAEFLGDEQGKAP
ncbi:MAG: ArsA family ATPase [Spirochaetia bacterium]|nr:ArsA family ATPase [Spirochaetia bacterium]